MRHAVRDKKHVATCLGFGPRFLHSTGQAYKGGPNSGVFLQITCDDAADLPVPGQKYTFGIVKAAQARGDFQVLASATGGRCACISGKDLKAGTGKAGSSGSSKRFVSFESISANRGVSPSEHRELGIATGDMRDAVAARRGQNAD